MPTPIKTTKCIKGNSTFYYYIKNNKKIKHRVNGPAEIIKSDYVIIEKWYVHGKLHRIKGPAFQEAHYGKVVKECWYNNNKLHQTHGPAVVNVAHGGNIKEWWLNGKRHRVDGPAIENKGSGTKEWWINGQRHRENGPAVEYVEGGKEYWINNKRHQTDGPAIERRNGTKEYWVNGKLHRENGPAIKHANGGYEYFKNGVLHRLNGPAIYYPASDYYYKERKEYWINNQHIDSKNYKRAVRLYKEKFKLNNVFNSFDKIKKGKLHNDDGPARIYLDGGVEYYWNGMYLSKKNYYRLKSCQYKPIAK